VLTQTNAFVGQLYIDLLGRGADPDGLAFWTAQLDTGVSPTNVALAFEFSPEGLAQEVRLLYPQFLHRGADQQGVDYFVGFLQIGGTLDQVRAAILGSPEYFQTRGASNNDTFFDALELDLLGHTASMADHMSFSAALAGGASRTDVALSVAIRREADSVQVQADFQKLLHRAAESPGGLDAFTDALQQGIEGGLAAVAAPMTEKSTCDHIASMPVRDGAGEVVQLHFVQPGA